MVTEFQSLQGSPASEGPTPEAWLARGMVVWLRFSRSRVFWGCPEAK